MFSKTVSKYRNMLLITKFFSEFSFLYHKCPFSLKISTVLYTKQSHTDGLKTAFKRVIQRTAEANGAFIGKKIADKIKKKTQKLHHKIFWEIVEGK